MISLQSCPLICEQLLSRYFLNLAFLCAFCFNHIFCSTKCFALLKERCPFRAIVTKSQEHTVTGVCSISSQCVNTLSIFFFLWQDCNPSAFIAIQVQLLLNKYFTLCCNKRENYLFPKNIQIKRTCLLFSAV